LAEAVLPARHDRPAAERTGSGGPLAKDQKHVAAAFRYARVREEPFPYLGRQIEAAKPMLLLAAAQAPLEPEPESPKPESPEQESKAPKLAGVTSTVAEEAVAAEDSTAVLAAPTTAQEELSTAQPDVPLVEAETVAAVDTETTPEPEIAAAPPLTQASLVEETRSLDKIAPPLSVAAVPLEPEAAGTEIAALAQAMDSAQQEPIVETPQSDASGESPIVTESSEVPAAAPESDSPLFPQAMHLQDLMVAAPRPQSYPVGPNRIAGPVSAPQMTLPGPALPPRLERFEEGNIVTGLGSDPRGKQDSAIPGWLITLAATLAVVVICVAVMFYVLPALSSSSRNPSSAAAATVSPRDGASPVSAVASSQQPLGKALEITGFRIGVDLTNKTVVQYIVVNHSSNEIAAATINVLVKAARGRFERSPIVSFSFRLPTIGPLESREMTTVLETPLRTGDVPDWQTLKPEIQVIQ